MTATWKYALIGGVATLPFTIGFYWQSRMGSEFSLNMVFWGGLLAGYLAARQRRKLKLRVPGSVPAFLADCRDCGS
ncbi:DUF5518 domain-containing protein [Halomicroarcula sp. GCM10025709]|uniref:DUF5518 domain-containing protein n=1 Tax=Halomicroarcula sp. GCM10025709 TaxID=3252669 RepID=UPI00361B41A1